MGGKGGVLLLLREGVFTILTLADKLAWDGDGVVVKRQRGAAMARETGEMLMNKERVVMSWQ
jgi:hypothetical protein